MDHNQENPSNAVYCRAVRKHFGSGSSKNEILCGLNMSVPYGAIYGLLGASGCGKTTLLKCIIGRMKVNSGVVRTLGQCPGSRGHQVPGRMVGYMPQEIALFMNFTIKETLNFFGLLHGMSNSDICNRCEFLVNFLNLPEHDRIIDNLSGGQQRRVSLAAALLQQPELLILDEPTVGVDPVLREKIWEHLLKIAKSNLKTTIIITTHYIEEAAQADRVGLMRGGRLLAENKPSYLMAKYELLNLEAVFLHLCHRDRLPNNDDNELLPSISEQYNAIEEDTDELIKPYSNGSDTVTFNGLGRRKVTIYGTGIAYGHRVSFKNVSPKLLLPSLKNLRAVAGKNLIFMKRNLFLMMFQFLVPVVQIILFCVCIGGEPHSLRLSICNEDVDELGGHYLSFIDNNTILQILKKDIDSAIKDVQEGTSWSAMHIKENFSLDLMTRLQDGMYANNQTIEGSIIMLYEDLSNQEIAITIKTKVSEAFVKFATSLIESFGYNPNLGNLPIKLGKPVYGTQDTSLTDFMSSGLIVSATFFLSCGLTALSLIMERKEGLMERMQVAGVSIQEIMMSHILTQLIIMMGQVFIMLLIALVVFNITNRGNIVVLVALIVLQGLSGMTLGTLISVFCNSEVAAVQVTSFLMYPSLLTSGVIWPIEAMPDWLMQLCLVFPLTYPTKAVRAIMGRGWGLDKTVVWSSYFTTLAWMTFNSIVACVIVKIKSF